MSLREKFEKLLANYTVRQEYKKSFKIVDGLLAAICEERDHDFSCFVGGKQVCQTCGEPYPFAAKLPLPPPLSVMGMLKDE